MHVYTCTCTIYMYIQYLLLCIMIFHSLHQITKCFAKNKLHDTSVYLLSHVTYGHMIQGPAIIIDNHRYRPFTCTCTYMYNIIFLVLYGWSQEVQQA